MKIYTVGHSTRRIEVFLSLINIYDIESLVDVRAFPVSRRNPQFNKDNLQARLSEYKIEYIWLGKELGGYRNKSDGLGEQSLSKGWKTEGFRIYSDYMLTERFKRAAGKLLEFAKDRTVVYMCAEKFYWRCHRRLISDYLLSLGHEIWHIIDSNKLQEHELTKFARVKDGILTYPPQKSPSIPLLPWP